MCVPARFCCASLGSCATVADGTALRTDLAQYPDLPIGDLCRAADFPAYDEVQMAHIAGMKKTMELLCAAVGVVPMEPGLAGPKAGPAPAAPKI